MNKPQIIKTERGEELVVLSRREYDAMRARAGDDEAEDIVAAHLIADAKAAKAAALPLSVWDDIDNAPSPIRPLRKWRKLTQEELAEKAGITQAYLSELETGRKVGNVATLRSIASALGVGIEDVTKE